MSKASEHYLLYEKPADPGPIFASTTLNNHTADNLLLPNNQYWTSGASGDVYIHFFFQNQTKLHLPSLFCLYNLKKSFNPNVRIKLELSSDQKIPVFTVNGSHSLGATTVSVNSTEVLTINSGEKIYINGNAQEYELTSEAIWAAPGDQNVQITPPLVEDLDGNEEFFRVNITDVVYSKEWFGQPPLYTWGDEWTPYSIELPWGGYAPADQAWYQDHFIAKIDPNNFTGNVFRGRIKLSGLTSGNYSITRLFIGPTFTSDGYLGYPIEHKVLRPNNKPVRSSGPLNYKRISARDRNTLETIYHTVVDQRDDVLFLIIHNKKNYIYGGNIPPGELSIAASPYGLDQWEATITVEEYEQ